MRSDFHPHTFFPAFCQEILISAPSVANSPLAAVGVSGSLVTGTSINWFRRENEDLRMNGKAFRKTGRNSSTDYTDYTDGKRKK